MRKIDLILIGSSIILAMTIFYFVELAFDSAIQAGGQKLYTVKTADAVYLDLSKERNNGNWASYKTTTGKRIIFNGTFTEIEQ